jgi:hypothetical protein
MRLKRKANVTPQGDEGFKIKSNFKVNGEELVATAPTLTEAKNKFQELADKKGVSSQGYSFALGIQDRQQ